MEKVDEIITSIALIAGTVIYAILFGIAYVTVKPTMAVVGFVRKKIPRKSVSQPAQNVYTK